MDYVLAPPPPPSPQQRRFIRMAWGGMTNKAIAAHEGCSPALVKRQLAEAYIRLGIDGLADPRTRAAVWLWKQERPSCDGTTSHPSSAPGR